MRSFRWLILMSAWLIGGCDLAGPTWRGAPASPPAEARFLERITVEQALAGPVRFSAGMTVTCRQDEQGGRVATLQAAGQLKEVAVPVAADFYALSDRTDVIVMHDRVSPQADAIRVFRFSPARVREQVFGHSRDTEGYGLRLYSEFGLSGGRLTVVEELSGGRRPDRPPTARRWVVPLD